MRSFNNAAFGQPGAIEDLTPALLREQLEVNLVGTHDLTRRLIPAMRKNGAGRIVNCSSVLGILVAPYRGAYCASKFALEALTTSLRLELEGSGIRVSLIEPGPIRSRFVEHSVARLLATIDIDSSPHRDIYRARLESMNAGGKAYFKLEPEAVSKRLVHAVESARPRRHYYVTTPTLLAAAMRRLLPQFAHRLFRPAILDGGRKRRMPEHQLLLEWLGVERARRWQVEHREPFFGHGSRLHDIASKQRPRFLPIERDGPDFRIVGKEFCERIRDRISYRGIEASDPLGAFENVPQRASITFQKVDALRVADGRASLKTAAINGQK